jgi:N-acetylneuraminic acid mutarotase
MKNVLILLIYGVMIMMFVSCRKNASDQVIVITSFDPVKGAAGNEVSITGTGFGNAITESKLFFNGTEADITSLTDTLITTVVPQGATTGKISISSNGHSAASEQDFVILPGTWIRKKDLPASGRMSASAFSIGAKGYLGIGFANDGNGAGPVLNDWWQYDPVADEWTQKADYAGGKTSNAIAFVINNTGYVGTGWDDARKRKKDFWAYDPVSDQWTRKADFPGPGRIDAVGFGIGNKGYAGTGDAVTDSGRAYLNDWWEYDPATDKWTQKTNYPSTANLYTAGFVIQNILYVGLGDSHSSCCNADWWAYDPATDQWTRKADFPNPGYNAQNCSFVIDNKGYILYMHDRAEFWQYDPALDQWNEQAFFDPWRIYSIAFAIGNKGYLGTGNSIYFGPPDSYSLNDIWEFTPSQ